MVICTVLVHEFSHEENHGSFQLACCKRLPGWVPLAKHHQDFRTRVEAVGKKTKITSQDLVVKLDLTCATQRVSFYLG